MNIHKKWIVIAMATVAAMTTGSLLGQQATTQSVKDEVALRAAMETETVQGDLKVAIEQYTTVAQSKDRSIAARALYQIGQAYEKLGHAEARKAYERIAREFADQKDVAADAGRRLAMLSGGIANSGRPTSSLVWKGNKVDLTGSVSADGRYLSFIDWDSGSVALHDFVTGEDRVIVEARHDPRSKWKTWAESSALSRDGKQVAYHWFDRTNGDHCEVWIANVTGDPNPRRCYDGQDAAWLEIKDWSPDGKWVSVLIYSKKDAQLGLISVADGSLRVLRSGEKIGNSGVFFSPDGKYVGYDLVQNDSDRRDVWVTAINGARHTAVVVHPGDDVMMGWSPDGSRLLFRSDRTGSIGLWSLPFSDGKSREAPQIIKADIGRTNSLGVTRSGTLFHGTPQTRSSALGSIHVGTFDFSSGAVAAPRDVGDNYLENHMNPCWSPDGRYLAYLADHASDRIGAKSRIVIRSAETNQVVRELPFKLRGLFVSSLSGWEPNGRALLAWGRESQEGRRRGAFRIDVETGEMTLLVEAPRTIDTYHPAWSADGLSLFYWRMAEDELAIIRREMASGEEKEIIRGRHFTAGVGVSPDGNYLTASSVDPASNDRLILIIPARGGKPRELMRIPANVAPADLNQVARLGIAFWSRDSRSIIARKKTDPSSNTELWHVPIDGGSPRKLDSLLGRHVDKFTLSPDGRTVAFRKSEPLQPEGRGKEVWGLENFLPAESRSTAAAR